MIQKTADGFWYQATAPMRLAYPVADFRFVGQDTCDMRAFPEQQPDTSDRLSGFFQDNGVCLRSGKDRADYLKTVFDRCVGRPVRCRTDFRTARDAG